jgi:hypothetical protein
MSFTGLAQPITQIIRVKFDFAANAPAGTVVLGKITTDPQQPAQDFLPVPSTEVWHITDIYAEDSGDIGADGYLDLVINDLRQNLRFGPMAQTLKTLLRPIALRQAIIVDRLSQLAFAFQNRAAVGASAVSTTITVEVVRVPVGSPVVPMRR